MPNQRVSIEEVRARRLAKEAQAEEGSQTIDKQGLAPIPGESHTEPPEPQQPSTSADAQLSTETSPETVSAAVPSTVAAAPNVPSLEAFIASASPEQLIRLRALAAAKGLTTTPAGATKHADGSMKCEIVISPEIVPQLEEWASADGIPLVEEIQNKVNEALVNYVFGDWSAMQVKPAEVVPVAAPAATK